MCFPKRCSAAQLTSKPHSGREYGGATRLAAIAIASAWPRFSESTPWCRGMRTSKSVARRVASVRPGPSAPATSATLSGHAHVVEAVGVGRRASAPRSRTPRAFGCTPAVAARCRSARSSGAASRPSTRAPSDASHGSAQVGSRIIASKPSAARRAGDGTDVLRVVRALEDERCRRGPRTECVHQRDVAAARGRGERAAVHVEAGDRLHHLAAEHT
jgi:hypothetical protein